MPKHKVAGFTLVELLVVIAIIGVLATIAVTGLSGARQKARDTKRIADVRQIFISLELHNNDYNGYPVELSPVTLGQGDYSALCESGFKDECDSDEIVFQGLVPSAPTPVDGSCSTGDNDYSYETPGGGEFVITFCLGGSVGDFAAGTHTASPSGIQ